MIIMKKDVLKFIATLLIVCFLCIGLVPNINGYFKDNITYEQYSLLLIVIVFTVFEIFLYLKLNDKLKQSFGLMEADTDFRRYKKENKYKEDKLFYYRDFPLDKNLFKIFWIAFQYNIINNRANVLNALLIKWCKEERLRFLSKGKYEILNNELNFDDDNEASLYYLLKNKSKNKFIYLTMFNSAVIFRKINEILLSETSKLRTENKIIKVKGRDVISNVIKPDVDTVFGFKNFLLNFGNIEDKTPNEVHLWDEYLIYAELLGISDQVKKELKKANIDYSSRETKFKKINRGIINFFKVLIFMSYLLYGIVFIVFTSLIWMIYIKLTW